MASSDDVRPAVLRLAPGDNVAVALRAIGARERVMLDNVALTVERETPVGHKIAARPIAKGEAILKYNCPIGRASCDIAPGNYVHTHNVASDYLPTYTLPT